MSNEMSLIPELRFPEFKEEEGWELEKVDDLIEQHSEKSEYSNQYPVLTSAREGITFQRDYYNDRDVASKDNTGYNVVPRGCFTYRHMSDDLIFKFNINNICDRGIVSTLYPVFKVKENKVLPYFFQQKLNEGPEFRKFAFSQKQGGSRTYMYLNKLKNLGLYIPRLAEQQKIASCLSSLDELIAAHNDKLAALKDHKKGLLQNLFPNDLNHDSKGFKDDHDLNRDKKSSHQANPINQGSDNVPKVRFPEFADDGEWELKPFYKFIKLYRGSSPRPIKEYLTDDESGVNWIKIGDTSSITDCVIRSVSEKITAKGAEKSRHVEKGELILANSMSYGSTYLLEIEGCIYDGWFVLREYEGSFDRQFLLQLLNSENTQGQYKKYAAGGIVQNISSEIVYSIALPKTSKEEQHKIASCLSAVDELITAQQEKIEQLQQHKKGMMQGLFPKIEG
jgi:type I restriction enzyme S subunit